jgi:hypothetical protein
MEGQISKRTTKLVLKILKMEQILFNKLLFFNFLLYEPCDGDINRKVVLIKKMHQEQEVFW